jgi:hypothetical protein
MNILRFKKPSEPRPPTIKKKPAPRLRVIQTEKDIRIPNAQFREAFAAWLSTVAGNPLWLVSDPCWLVVTNNAVGIFAKGYAVMRKTGDIYTMENYRAGKHAIGNVLNWS